MKTKKIEIQVDVLLCPFCSSRRLHFYGCSDDGGEKCSVRCDRCEAEGPGIRSILHDRVTPEMKAEAALAWNAIGTCMDPPLYYVKIGTGQFVSERQSRRHSRAQTGLRKATKKMAEARRAGGDETALTAIAVDRPVTNGHNGHAQ